MRKGAFEICTAPYPRGRYETSAPQNPGRKIASGHDHLVVAGLFEVTSIVQHVVLVVLCSPPCHLGSLAQACRACNEPLLSMDTSQGVTVENTKMPHGLQTEGVDDVGFFNMRDDNVETYLTALAA